MYKTLRVLSLLLLLSLLPAYADGAQAGGAAAACHAFFASVQSKDYGTAWNLLTAKSQNEFIKGVADSEHMDAGKVRSLFNRNDQSLQKGFWDSFRGSVHADIYMAATMKTTNTSGSKANVKVTAQNGNSLNLLAFNEGGKWKLGYTETFFPKGLNAK